MSSPVTGGFVLQSPRVLRTTGSEVSSLPSLTWLLIEMSRHGTDLLTLPTLVLSAPSRGGRKHVLRQEGETRRRCLDWLSGIRADLWAPLSVRATTDRDPPAKDGDHDVLPASVIARVTTLIQEGALRRACAALLQDPPVRPTDDVVASLRLLHPGSSVEDRLEMGSLRGVASGAAPSADVDQVRKALLSFPSTSGAGRSGLRPSHVRDALRPASSDLLLQLLSEVVSLLLRGEVPESIRPYVCGASIMALRKPNGSLRPIAIGETIRRLTSKVAVDLITERPARFSSLCNLGSRRLMGVRPSFMLPGSGFLATALTLTRSPSLLMCPTLSTRFTEPLSCGPCASIFRPFLHGSTAVTATRAPCSPALATLLYSPFAALGAFNKVTPRSDSLRFSRSSCHC